MTNNKPITKKEMRKELGEFTEEVLLPSMQEIFVTKKEMRKELGEFTEEVLLPSMQEIFVTKDELKNELEDVKEEIKKETIRGTDRLINKADEIIKKLDEKKVEDIVGIEAYKRHDEKLEDHEQRIGQLETKAT